MLVAHGIEEMLAIENHGKLDLKYPGIELR